MHDTDNFILMGCAMRTIAVVQWLLHWCITGVPTIETDCQSLLSAYFLPANLHISVVEPRGFEPLTSAVQRRRDEFASVRQCSKEGLFERNSLSPPFSPFANVRPGNCQVTVRCPSGYGS
jgi:hypothetical protein